MTLNAEKNVCDKRLPEETIMQWYNEYAGNKNDSQNCYHTFGEYAQEMMCRSMTDMKNQDINVAEYIGSCRMNLILATENEQYQALSSFYVQSSFEELAEMNGEDFEELSDNALTYLIHQQGHTVEEVFSVFDSMNTESCFVGSVADEINFDDSMTASQVVVLVSAGGQELLDLLDCIAKKEGNLEISEEAKAGLFSSDIGDISIMEIQFEKNLIIPSDMVQNLQIEGAGTKNKDITVRQVYGLRDSEWEKGYVSITDKSPELINENMDMTKKYVEKLSHTKQTEHDRL